MNHRGSITKEDAIRKFEAISLLLTLSIKEPTFAKAIDMAVGLKITLYDASYLALAKELGALLITADREIYEKGRKVAKVIYISEI